MPGDLIRLSQCVNGKETLVYRLVELTEEEVTAGAQASMNVPTELHPEDRRLIGHRNRLSTEKNPEDDEVKAAAGDALGIQENDNDLLRSSSKRARRSEAGAGADNNQHGGLRIENNLKNTEELVKLGESNKKLRQKIQILETEKSELHSKLCEMEAQQKEQEKLMIKLKESNEAAKEREDSLQKEKETLETHLAEASTQLTQAKQQCQEVEAREKASAEAAQSSKEKISLLSAELGVSNENISKLKNELNEAIESVNKEKSLGEELGKEMVILQDNIANLNKQVELVSKEREELTILLENQKLESENLREQLLDSQIQLKKEKRNSLAFKHYGEASKDRELVVAALLKDIYSVSQSMLEDGHEKIKKLESDQLRISEMAGKLEYILQQTTSDHDRLLSSQASGKEEGNTADMGIANFGSITMEDQHPMKPIIPTDQTEKFFSHKTTACCTDAIKLEGMIAGSCEEKVMETQPEDGPALLSTGMGDSMVHENSLDFEQDSEVSEDRRAAITVARKAIESVLAGLGPEENVEMSPNPQLANTRSSPMLDHIMSDCQNDMPKRETQESAKPLECNKIQYQKSPLQQRIQGQNIKNRDSFNQSPLSCDIPQIVQDSDGMVESENCNIENMSQSPTKSQPEGKSAVKQDINMTSGDIAGIDDW